MAIARRIKPLKSNVLTDASVTFGIALKVTNIPSKPIGTLIKKIQCQDAYSTNHPPKMGPINGPNRPARLMVLMADKNCSRGMMRSIAKRPTGRRNAPPIP